MKLSQRIALMALLLCMALAQSLSFAHRTLHHDLRMLGYAHEEQFAQAHGHDGDCDHGVFSRLFSGHEDGDESCRVLDGSCATSDAPNPSAPSVPALYAHVFIALSEPTPAAWQTPLFKARDPPALSL